MSVSSLAALHPREGHAERVARAKALLDAASDEQVADGLAALEAATQVMVEVAAGAGPEPVRQRAAILAEHIRKEALGLRALWERNPR